MRRDLVLTGPAARQEQMRHSRVRLPSSQHLPALLTQPVVSKAFQVLSDTNLRASFDSNPSFDPTQRNPGMGGGGGGMRTNFSRGGGGMYADELNPEDLFNMFFGGGGGGGFGGNQFGNANGKSTRALPMLSFC